MIFIDLARALAVVFMLYGHTVSALLAPRFRTGTWFEIWTFQRGLTSSLFLLLSGFAFSVATSRHWPLHLHISGAWIRRVRRFALFILLGYALHIPVSRLAQLPAAGDERWRSFLAVDVLQLIGVTFIGVQLLVLLTRTRAAFTAAAFTLSAAVVAATPAVWGADWTGVLPPWAAAYLTPTAGSLFPLFPWSAFVLAGAGFGQLYARWGAANLEDYTSRALLGPGLALILAVFAARALVGEGAWSVVPADVAIRVGACLIVLAAIAYGSRRIDRLPHVFGAVAQETLLIYFVHLCIVYGSVWNRGLAQTYGTTLGPGATVLWVLLLVVSMGALAFYWNRLKHVSPRGGRLTALGAGAVLLYQLL